MPQHTLEESLKRVNPFNPDPQASPVGLEEQDLFQLPSNPIADTQTPAGPITPPTPPGLTGGGSGILDQQKSMIQQLLELGKQQLGDKEFNKLLLSASGLSKPEEIGPNILGRGGILGTGLEPMDVLAFAFGAALTSNLPQNQAIQTTLQLAQLPNQFRDNQRKSANEFINRQLQVLNAGTAIENAEQQRQIRSIELNKLQRQEGIIEELGALGPDQPIPQSLKARAVGAGVLPASALVKQVTTIDTVDDQGSPIKVVVDAGTLQPIIDSQGRPTIYRQAPKGGGLDKDLTAGVRQELRRKGIDPRQATETQIDNAIVDFETRSEAAKTRIAGTSAAARERSVQSIKAGIDAENLARLEGDVQATFRLVDKVVTATTTPGAARQGIVQTLKSFVSATDAGLYSGLVNALAVNVGRSLGGEKGVMTDRDVDRILKQFPTFTDSVATAQFKRDRLDLIFRFAFEQKQRLIDGAEVNLADTRKSITQMIDQMETNLNKRRTGKPQGAGEEVK